jgi:WD40 repeat protein
MTTRAKSFGILSVVLFAFIVHGLAQAPKGTNGSILKVEKLFDLKKNGAYIFTFCPASRDLFVSFDEDTSRTVHRWNVDSGKELDAYTFPKKYRCDLAVVSADGKLLILAAYDMLHDALSKANKVRFIDVRTGKLLKELSYESIPVRIEFSRDGKMVVTRKYSYDRGGEQVFDLLGNEQKNFDLKVFDSQEKPVAWTVQNSKGGPRPGVFCVDSDGKEHRLYPDEKTYWSDTREAVVSGDKRYVTCSSNDGKLMVWRLADAKMVFQTQLGKNAICIVDDPKAGRFLVAESDPDKTSRLEAAKY